MYNGLIFVLEHHATNILFPNCFIVAKRNHEQPISRDFSVWSPWPIGSGKHFVCGLMALIEVVFHQIGREF